MDQTDRNKDLRNFFKIDAEFINKVKCVNVQAIYRDGYSATVVNKKGNLESGKDGKINTEHKDKKLPKIKEYTLTKKNNPSKDKLMGIDPGHKFIITGFL